MENIVFIYSMPGYNCSIRERMLYSSCKNPLIEVITSLGLDIVKKVSSLLVLFIVFWSIYDKFDKM